MEVKLLGKNLTVSKVFMKSQSMSPQVISWKTENGNFTVEKPGGYHLNQN